MQNKSMIQELPTEERPYEKCLRCGPSVLSDSELLAVIIRSGTQGSSSIDLARKVLDKGTLQKGLLGIHHLSLQELMEIKGIGQVKAVQIKCIGELSKRIASVSARHLLDIEHPETIAAYYMEQMRHQEQERMLCMMLNGKSASGRRGDFPGNRKFCNRFPKRSDSCSFSLSCSIHYSGT